VDSDSGFGVQEPDIRGLNVEDEPPLKRHSTATSWKPSRWGINQDISGSDNNNALEEKLFTISERQPSQMGSLEERLESHSIGSGPGNTEVYRGTYGFGAGELPQDWQYPEGISESSDSGIENEDTPMVRTMSRLSRLGNAHNEAHFSDQHNFREPELELGVAKRIGSTVLSSM
jgi:hypothetical protein